MLIHLSSEILLSSCQNLQFLRKEDQWTNKDSSQSQLVAEVDSVEVEELQEEEEVAASVAEVVVIEEEEVEASVEVAEVPQEAEEEATDSNLHHYEFNLD